MTDQTETEPSWYLRYLPALLWPLIIIGLSAEIHLRFDPLSSYLFEHCAVYQDLPNADELHQQVLDCYRGDDHLDKSPFHSSERSHFRDVSTLLSLLRWATIIALLIIIPASIKHQLRYQWMRLGFYFFCAGNLALALIGSRWLLFFRGMHPLVFSGESWDFHPRDLILRLYPETYLAAYASVISLSSLILGLILFTWALHKDTGPLANPLAFWKDKHYTWSKRLGDVSLMLALCSVPCYLSGRSMINPWGFEWNLYWALCLCVLIACFTTVILRNLATAVMLIVATALLLQCFAFGVRSSTESAHVGLKKLRIYAEAIDAYKAESGHYPKDLDALYSYKPELPQGLPAPFHKLHYTNEGRMYSFYFVGPLSYEFSYRSDSDYWNFMRLP